MSSDCDGIAVIDQEHRVVEANDRFAEMLGYAPEEVLGLYTWDFDAVMTEAEIRENFSDLTRTETVFETRHRRKDGTILDVEVGASGTKLGDVPIVYTICRDISERKRSEEKIRDSEQRMRALSDATFESIFFSDRGICIDQNLSAEKNFGYTMEEAVGRHGTEWIVPEDRDRVLRHMMIGYEKPYEVTALRKDGTTFPSEIQARMFEYQGRRIRVTTLRDITDRKAAERGLRESEAKFRTLFDASPLAMVLVEKGRGRVSDANGEFCRWMKRPKTDLVGKTVQDLGFQSEADRIRFRLEMDETGCLNGLAMDFLPPEGEVRNSRVYARIVDVSGKPQVLAMFADTTEQRQLEAALVQARKMEAVGTLAGGIAHEFNNILGIIIGNAELAVDELQENDLAASCLEEIRIASLRAKDVVRKILSIARKVQSSKKTLRIASVVRDSLNLLRAIIPATIAMERRIDCDTESVLADPTEIDQVLMNLCNNAVQAMEPASGTISVRLHPVTLDAAGAANYENLDPGNFVRLSLSDNGSGISPDTMGCIFDPYFTTREVDEGLGMGLAIVYGIVRKHDGAIRVESTLGKGTTVEVLLPQIDGPADEPSAESVALPRGGEKILFVDDEPSIVHVGKRHLDRLGYTVVGMTSSVAAAELFAANPDRFDMVITDMAMPEMAGDRLAAEILRIRPGMPILMCTGHSEQMDEELALSMGFAAYRIKPLDRRELAETVRQVLDRDGRSETKGLGGGADSGAGPPFGPARV